MIEKGPTQASQPSSNDKSQNMDQEAKRSPLFHNSRMLRNLDSSLIRPSQQRAKSGIRLFSKPIKWLPMEFKRDSERSADEDQKEPMDTEVTEHSEV